MGYSLQDDPFYRELMDIKTLRELEKFARRYDLALLAEFGFVGGVGRAALWGLDEQNMIPESDSPTNRPGTFHLELIDLVE
jgi:hypothetical protein